MQKLEILEERKEGVGLTAIIFGLVVLAHIKDEVLVEGIVEPSRLQLIARVGKDKYCNSPQIHQFHNKLVVGELNTA